MDVFSLALVAAAAAQAAAPQSGVKWETLQAAQPTPSSAQRDVDKNEVASPPLTVVTPNTVASSAAPAAVQPTRILLWRNITDGMPMAQLRSLYPQGPNVEYKDDRTVLTNVPIIEGCQAKVNILHPKGVISEIVMRGEGSIAGRCSLRLITALSGKYGEPMDKDKVHGSWFAREGKNYLWAHDGVTLQLKRYTNGPFGGGGLLAASWELRYSAVDTKIDL